MNTVIIGAGALGSLFAARLSQAGQQVILFDYNPSRASAVNNHITLLENNAEYTFAVPVTSAPSCLKQANLVLLCTKSSAVEQGLTLIKDNSLRQPITLGFQNGILHIESITKMKQGGFGITAQGATLIKPGYVRHGGDGPTVIGMSQDREPLEPIADLLSSARIPTKVSTDIKSKLWQKLLINVGINGLTVLYQCPNGELLNIPAAKKTLIALVAEAQTVAHALGIKIDKDPAQRCIETCKATATNISSMLQDFRRHKDSEIMAINGALVHEAKKVGIATPENDLLIHQVLKMWSDKTREPRMDTDKH